jgi:hypothetical protein
VVRGLGPSTTSSAILLETPGAALIAALWLGQTPPAAAYPALGVILAGLALVILADRRKSAAGPRDAEPDAVERDAAEPDGAEPDGAARAGV